MRRKLSDVKLERARKKVWYLEREKELRKSRRDVVEGNNLGKGSDWEREYSMAQ